MPTGPRCSANICPLDSMMQKRLALPGERLCTSRRSVREAIAALSGLADPGLKPRKSPARGGGKGTPGSAESPATATAACPVGSVRWQRLWNRPPFAREVVLSTTKEPCPDPVAEDAIQDAMCRKTLEESTA